MANYIVTYDLHKPGQRYADVYAYIQRHRYEHVGTSAWVIQSDKTPEAIRIDLQKVTDPNDYFFVFTLNSTWNAWGPPEVLQRLVDLGLRPG